MTKMYKSKDAPAHLQILIVCYYMIEIERTKRKEHVNAAKGKNQQMNQTGEEFRRKK